MTTLTALACAIVLAPQQQEANPYAVPAEFEKAKFMLGTWESKGTGMGLEGTPVEVTGKTTTKIVMDRWYESTNLDVMEGFGEMHGRFMLTYNNQKNHWEGVWFDSMSSYSMRATGTLKDNTMTLMSEEVSMEGQPMQFRLLWVVESPSSMKFTVDMKAGDSFVNVLTHNYKKQ